jgi:hypothetical protein
MLSAVNKCPLKMGDMPVSYATKNQMFSGDKVFRCFILQEIILNKFQQYLCNFSGRELYTTMTVGTF